ncbi:hypothetical protein S40288_11033 [Stachybotrys chartarum IBT 40288]|nr:hypothetical protein S40288_11033 [Stachybotrys chartarum IBT 40288]
MLPFREWSCIHSWPLLSFLTHGEPLTQGARPATELPDNKPSIIRIIEYQHGVPSTVRDVDESELKNQLQRGPPHRVFLVENLSPTSLLLLGGHLNVDPQAFLDYLGAIPEEYDLTKGGKTSRARRDIIPTPWFRFESIEAHVPVSATRQSIESHISIRYVSPLEFRGAHSDRRILRERIQADLNKLNVERVAGLYLPMPRDGYIFPHLALARQYATLWLGKASRDSTDGWQVIILLDPPFRARSGDYGEIKDSVYNPIVRHLTPHAGAGSSVHPVPLTRRGIDLMAHYLTCGFLGQGVGIPSVSSVLRDLVLMISYEWTNVATYFERDLNTIEWRLERDSLPIEALAEMQQRLFSNRRRLRKYKQTS